MRCISVYTKDFEVFSDIYEQILELNMAENEEIELEGITVSDAGDVSEDYIEKMRAKPEVAIMRVKKKGAIILQHGEVFEVIFPGTSAEEETA
jgi:hypothetical protein